MPKEQPCLREHHPCPPSSKNAKDKRNSTILMAIRDTKDAADSNRRGSSCSSEKDSGYSDSSDWQHTDLEVRRTNTGQFRPKEVAQPSQSGQSKEPGLKNPTTMPVRVNHPPIYIIKDMTLKKPAMIQKRGQLLWTNGVRVSSHSGSPHVILFEQPRGLPATIELHKPSSRSSNMTTMKTNSTYLSIPKTYPSIAPHPSKKPPDKSSSYQDYQNLSKRVCTEKKTDETPAARGVPEQHLPKQPNLTVSHSGLLCSSSSSHSLSSSTPTVTSSVPGSLLMSGHTTSSFPSNRLNKNISVSTRHRRFLNTVEILKQSGLLDITLRTKELLRQNNVTEQDISQLRQHTELLCQAANNPTLSLNGTTAWEHLHQVMAESGNYPNLKIQQKLQGPSHLDFVSQQESIPIDVMNRPQAAESLQMPSSCLLASTTEQSHTKQSKKPEAGNESSGKVPFMSPDSSTD
ncbi:CLOCK-interacting pacemaker [Melanotaenia boesemani]|uniref:CLOCK-interacting pacemaker n=1 Tax=Melanotaenia boesemani TaxID=1250792 RepID=UPI001C0597FA|nr:CLOCK-interacting pacemaker [Melanotaenia boesemani]XP_041850418.1 CLOCK-interacting pacemaker [Melanotaenia boesemani]XP_041850419.1 CLOCK-interacting pacemaker [Melanotaenia boesemani]